MGTIAEKFINEGMQQGIQKGMLQGIQKGMLQAIEMDLEIKFGSAGLRYAQKIKNTGDVQQLKKMMKTVKLANSLDELDQLLN